MPDMPWSARGPSSSSRSVAEMGLSARAVASLRRHLDIMAAEYDYSAHLLRDPLRFVLGYAEAADQEVAGVVAACLAYGRVDRVLVSAADALARMGPHPARFVHAFDPRGRAERRVFRGFLHRMTAESEMRALCGALGAVLREHGSLENLFAQGIAPSDPTIRGGLAHLVATVRTHARGTASAARDTRRLRFLLPSPQEGSACKRLNMWLRWMVRCQPGLDPGVWRAARPAQLIIPLDVHVVRLSRFFGLTTRRTPDWKMAEEVTATLRKLDANDPVKYDFALSHVGMSRAFLPAV